MDTVNIYRLSFVSCLVMAMPCALAVEFNLNVLDKSMRDRIDISLLKEKGVIAPGEYFVSVAVNNNQISNGQKINWQKKGDKTIPCIGNDSNLLIVFYVQIMPDDFVMQLHRF